MKLMKAFIGIFRPKISINPCTKLNKPVVLIRSLAPCRRRRLLHRRYRHKLFFFFFFFNPVSSKAMSSPSPSFFSMFRSPKRSPKHKKNKLERDDDNHHHHLAGPSIDVPEVEAVLFLPSPLSTVSPADHAGYNNNGGRESGDQRMREGGGSGGGVEVEEACRRFEKHLVEMIVEEGKMKDLMDVEELLCCWKKLKCPVFVDLVCRFYGELCMDLFSSQTIHETS